MASFQETESSADYDGVFYDQSSSQYADNQEYTYEDTDLAYFTGQQLQCGSIGTGCIDDDNENVFDIWPVYYSLLPIWELPFEVIMDSGKFSYDMCVVPVSWV